VTSGTLEDAGQASDRGCPALQRRGNSTVYHGAEQRTEIWIVLDLLAN